MIALGTPLEANLSMIRAIRLALGSDKGGPHLSQILLLYSKWMSNVGSNYDPALTTGSREMDCVPNNSLQSPSTIIALVNHQQHNKNRLDYTHVMICFLVGLCMLLWMKGLHFETKEKDVGTDMGFVPKHTNYFGVVSGPTKMIETAHFV